MLTLIANKTPFDAVVLSMFGLLSTFPFPKIPLSTLTPMCNFLFQPFRGNPGYDEVTDLPFSTSCLKELTSQRQEINIKSISACRMETMFSATCINER